MQWFRIVVLSVAACVLYGVLHDQVTARICVEYFTIGHPPIFPTQDPTWLGIGWGVLATWWVGVLLGAPLATVARIGTAPRRTAGDLVRPVGLLIIVSAAVACGMGLIGWWAARNGWVFLVGDLAERVPPDKHLRYLAALWAHNGSYAAGFVGGAVLILMTWRGRRSRRAAVAEA
ncbi:MAG: hypothetical protein EA381_02270 [Planctomycetaceae bacterium]|nr:MAG: hypothetical protein EA381_02270 [Planctomycetaceae bacterium]